MRSVQSLIAAFILYTACSNSALGQSVPQGYYSYSQIVAIADSLAQAYPSICKKIMLGTSQGGRQVFALKISDNAGIEEDEPEILFDGGIHGNEVGGPQNLVMYARDLCRKYNHLPQYTEMINSRQIWLYLMVNPDGRDNMSRFTDAGVDINRDFGYMWNGGGTSPYPFSQTETRMLRDFMLAHQFSVYTDYHSGTEIIAYPWSYRPDASRDNAVLDSLAAAYSRESGYTSLLYGQGFNVMYPVIGSTKDFQYGINGGVSWSMELSVSQQPQGDSIQLFYNINLPAMNEMVKRSGWGIRGSVKDSLSGAPVTASVWISSLYPVMTRPSLGNFCKYVTPGVYSVKVSANGYKTKVVPAVSVPDSGFVLLDVRLGADPKFYAGRICSCQIPGFNYFDEGYTPGCAGAPDNIPYSIGHNGWVVVDMGDTVYDGPGNDFRVWQSGTSIKTFGCYGSTNMDGPWTLIGNAMYTADFDLQPSGLQKARYLKITDGGTAPATGVGAGYNLDAVEMLTIPLKAGIMAEHRDSCQGNYIQFHDITQGTVSGRQWTFEGGSPSTSVSKDPLVFYPSPGSWDVSLRVSNSYCTSSRTDTSYIRIYQTPLAELGNDTTVCTWASVSLDAGNPGCRYLWSTGDTSRTISVDTSSAGAGTQLISVTVTSWPGCASSDSVHISFQPCPGIEESPGEVFSLYPNPNDGHFVLLCSFRGFSIEIYDSRGIPVSTLVMDDGSLKRNLDLSGLPGGLYLALVKSGNQVFNRRFVIRR